MDRDQLEATATRLREVNDILKELDPSIRSEAFTLLRDYVVQGGEAPTGPPEERTPSEREQADEGYYQDLVSTDNARDFLGQHAGDKESDNVKAIAALIYSRYGNAPFTPSEVEAIAHEAGITIPDRVDVTLYGSSSAKKKLFSKKKTGVFSPTVHGERFFKREYGVTKGTQKRPDLPS